MKTKIDYDDIDPELRELVRLLNTVKGMKTTDCCFGHPGRTCNHHSEAYIGLKVLDRRAFNRFWRALFKVYDAKIHTKSSDGYFQFVVQQQHFASWAHPLYFDFIIIPEHDPGRDRRGRKEKILGIKTACDFIRQWTANQRSANVGHVGRRAILKAVGRL